MKKRERIIFHIDVNSAFLSWSAVEELDKANREGRTAVDLRDVPSIVGGDASKRRGIVTAASIPAKRRGVRTVMTLAEAFRLCPDLVVVSSDFGLYRTRSRQLMELLLTYSPLLQKMSVDECFLDLTEALPTDEASVREEAIRLAYVIKDRVREELGFTVNVGISTNKLLAKMASDFEKPDKVHTLFVDEIEEKMWPLEIGELFMCGKSSAAQLRKLGIHSIGDLAKADPQLIDGHLKSHGRMLMDFANGRASDQVETEREKAKSESVEHTLANDCVDLEEAQAYLREIALRLAGRLRNHGTRAGELAVIVKYSDFKSTTHQKKLLTVTDEAEDFAREASALFEEVWDGRPVRLLGIRAGRLVGRGDPVQMSLVDFEKEKVVSERKGKADAAMKSLKEKYGEHVIFKGKK